jgi:hypothetical protein
VREVSRADLDQLKPLWLTVHHHHQMVVPELHPYVSSKNFWQARRALYKKSIAAGGRVIPVHVDGMLVGYSVHPIWHLM